MPKVLFIAGASRGGSTLVDRLLGQLDGFQSTGELAHIWRRGLLKNQRCGCGVPFRKCRFWRDVLERGAGLKPFPPARDLVRLRDRLESKTSLPALLARRPPSSLLPTLQPYADALARLYRAIKFTSGCRVVVDSSKRAYHGLILRHTPGVDLRVLHLVRDSRGVAYSWSRRKRRPESSDAPRGAQHWMSRRSAFDSARMWMRENTLLHALALTGVSSKRMRYEDIVAAPAESLAEICRWIGEPPPNLSFLDGSQARLAAAHTVSGNPVRFQTGDLTLRVDDEWRRKMPRRSSLLVTALTAPFLFHYGYLPAAADRKRHVGPKPDRGLAESAGA